MPTPFLFQKYLAVDVETNARKSKWHCDGAKNSKHCTEGDAQLAPDQLDLVAREIDVEKEDQQGDGKRQELGVKLQTKEWDQKSMWKQQRFVSHNKMKVFNFFTWWGGKKMWTISSLLPSSTWPVLFLDSVLTG